MIALDADTAERWGLALLAADRMGRRLPPDGRAAVVRAALAHGREAARRCRVDHGTADPLGIAARLPLRVEWCADPPALGAMVRIAEYQRRPATIRLYAESIEAILAADRAWPVAAIYVAHELFHHLESTTGQRASDFARVALVSIGPWRWTSGISALSEIAAHAFAEGLLDLPFFPGVLDRRALPASACVTGGRDGRDSRDEAHAAGSELSGARWRLRCYASGPTMALVGRRRSGSARRVSSSPEATRWNPR